jgi:hypothetical protein
MAGPYVTVGIDTGHSERRGSMKEQLEAAVPLALLSKQPSTELTLPEIPTLSSLLQEFVNRLPEQLVSRIRLGGPWPNAGDIVGW